MQLLKSTSTNGGAGGSPLASQESFQILLQIMFKWMIVCSHIFFKFNFVMQALAHASIFHSHFTGEFVIVSGPSWLDSHVLPFWRFMDTFVHCAACLDMFPCTRVLPRVCKLGHLVSAIFHILKNPLFDIPELSVVPLLWVPIMRQNLYGKAMDKFLLLFSTFVMWARSTLSFSEIVYATILYLFLREIRVIW
jgi:hypothetical protein